MSSNLRSAIRRELSLAEPCRHGPSSKHVGLSVVSVLLGLLASTSLTSQPPYRQEVVPGLSSLKVSSRCNPNLAEIDSDGDSDLFAGVASGFIEYFENTGGSSAAAFVEQTGSANPLDGIQVAGSGSPELADLDGDGDLDAVIGEFLGTVRFLENTGSSTVPSFLERTGALNPFFEIDVGEDANPKVVDLDGDGDLDAVVGGSYGDPLYLENTGSTLAPAYAPRVGHANPFNGIDVGDYSSPSLADIDGDGDHDAIVGEYSGVLNFLLNSGSATEPHFVQLTGTASPVNRISFRRRTSPDLLDLDHDGDLDIVVGDYTGFFRHIENTGNATDPRFSPYSPDASPLDGLRIFGGRTAPDLADLDGDGDLDATIGTKGGSLEYAPNTGHSTSPLFRIAFLGESPFGSIKPDYETAPEMVDLDRDGDLDVVVGSRYGHLRFLHNTGTPQVPLLVERTGSANPFDGINLFSNTNPDVVDLDNDGDFDAVVGVGGGALTYLENTGVATGPAFVVRTGSANPFNAINVGFSAAPSLADIDRDGDLDAIIGERFGTLKIFANTGTSAAPAFLELTGTANPFFRRDVGRYSSPDLVDVDADGDLDAVVGEILGHIVFYRSLANDIFADGFETGDASAWSLTVP